MKKIFAALAVTASVFFAACSSAPAPSPDGAKPVGQSNLMMLTELKNNYVSAGGVAGVGEGVATKEQNALSQAQMYARADIASTLGAKSQQLVKAWHEEVSGGEAFEANDHMEQVNKDIVSEKVAGATTVKMMTEVLPDGRYKVAVLTAMSPEALAKFAEALRNSEAVTEAIRAKADAAYQEADEVFDKYEEMKNRANEF